MSEPGRLPERGDAATGREPELPGLRDRMWEKLLGRIRVGMGREEVVAVLGPPDAEGPLSRNGRLPKIYKYAGIELHFRSERLWMVYTEDADLNGIVLLGGPDSTPAGREFL